MQNFLDKADKLPQRRVSLEYVELFFRGDLMAARRKARKKKKQQPHAIHGIVIIFFAIFCYAGLFFTPQTGTAGFVISYLLKIIAGEGALLLPLLFLAAGFSKILHHKISNFKSRFAGLLILILLALTSAFKSNALPCRFRQNFYNTAMNLAIDNKAVAL